MKPALENLKNSACYLGAKEGLWPDHEVTEACSVLGKSGQEDKNEKKKNAELQGNSLTAPLSEAYN